MLSIKNDYWRNLDNAAKIFPATSNEKDTRVFRFYCECTEPIEKEPLQLALDKTMEQYPVFCSVLRKGLFWFYFEKSDLRPVVTEEMDSPCLNLYIKDLKTLLFRVTYYQNRINFEVFHALTDGTGASMFLKELVKNYLQLRYPDEQLPDYHVAETDMTLQDQESDGFDKYYKLGSKNKKSKVNAYQLTGDKCSYGDLNIIEGVVSCKAVLAAAKKYGVSMTVFLTAVLLCAIHEDATKRLLKKPISLMVPVNLRKYFPSTSMLNFFGWIEPFYLFPQDQYDFDDVVNAVNAYFKQELTKERLGQRLNYYVQMERNPILRFCPLGIKNLGMKIGSFLSKNDTTAIFSNMGNLTMPPEYAHFVQRFGVFTSTPKIELCICSFKDDLVLSFTSGFQNQNIQRNFYRILKNFDIETEILKDQFPKRGNDLTQIKFFQYFSFACIASIIICLMVNYIFTPDILWSVFVAGGAFSMWGTLAIGFYKRHNLLKNGLWQMFIIPALCIVWDYYTGWHGWSLDFCMPCVYLVIKISMVIITKIQKLSVSQYMIYYIMADVIGLLPVVLLQFRTTSFVAFPIICSGICFLSLIGMLIFQRKNFFVELKKMLHI